jgi:SH3-like domain-containing protein
VRHLLAVKRGNYRARVIFEITTKILLSIGICKAKWLKIDCESAEKGRLDLPSFQLQIKQRCKKK